MFCHKVTSSALEDQDIDTIFWLKYDMTRDNIGSYFSPPKRPDLLWGPLSLLFKGHRGSSAGVKRPGREFDHYLHAVPSLGMSGAILLLSLCAFIAWKGTAFHLHLFVDGKLNKMCKCEVTPFSDTTSTVDGTVQR